MEAAIPYEYKNSITDVQMPQEEVVISAMISMQKMGSIRLTTVQ